MRSQLRGALDVLIQAIEEVNACSDDRADSRDQVFKFTTDLEQKIGQMCFALERNSELCKQEGWYGEADRLDFYFGVCNHLMNINRDCMVGYTIEDFSEKLDRKFAMLMKMNQISYEYTKERPEPLHLDPEYLAELDEVVHRLETVIGALRGKYMDIFQRVCC